MKKGDKTELKVKKILCKGKENENKALSCKFVSFDSKKECLFLEVLDENLQEISLDVIYECSIFSDSYKTVCTGRVKERYCDENGKIVRINIENGFYKININSVDKQIV